MFNFGIFSTHLPYLAFVFFYAFFFLIGIPKASAGDFSEGEIIKKQEIPAVAHFRFSEKKAVNGPGDLFFNQNKAPAFAVAVPGPLKLLIPCLKKTRQNEFFFTRFSRPPPGV